MIAVILKKRIFANITRMYAACECMLTSIWRNTSVNVISIFDIVKRHRENCFHFCDFKNKARLDPLIPCCVAWQTAYIFNQGLLCES